MNKLELRIGEWRICLPHPWVSLNEQTCFRCQPLRGQLQISTAKHMGGTKPVWDAPALRKMLFAMAVPLSGRSLLGHASDRAWAEECERRLDRYLQGGTTTLDAEEVLAKYLKP